MEGILLSIVAKIAEYTVYPFLDHAQYFCCFNNFTQNLPNAKEELELTRESVNERVREAINRTEKIEPSVEKWLKDVEKVLDEVQLLEGRISEVSKSCFRRRCQYFLAKKIARKIEKMIQLKQNSKFEPFSRSTELPGMKYYSSKGFILFKSTELAYNKLLEALENKSVPMVGLVGLGGSGKTTLAKEVGKKVEELKLFEKVVMTTISQTPNTRSIQAQIADKLGVQLNEESEEGRAQRLSMRLREGTTLLILDDVWEKLDFEALGIPIDENKRSCGLLLTSRSRQVCSSMQSESIIDLNLLNGEEGWTLFKAHANIVDDCVDALEDVARKIVNKCEGLPIAIVTVGSTLRGKTFQDWRLALSRLEDSKPLDIPKGLRCPYVCLELSYDNLTNQLAKSLFLLCSIFPEDHEIDLEDLFRFGRRQELIETFGTMEKARMEMQIAVNILMDYCLLLQANNKERVKMHDMVRDVALWIASKRGQAILARTAMDPRMFGNDENISGKIAISLWDLNDGQFPDEQLNCPSLEILLLHSPEVGFEVSNVFLERLKMLKILAFLRFDYGFCNNMPTMNTLTLSLPKSIELLKNLHTLCLRGYKLGDITILGRLQALEILDLRGSSFEELPNGIVAFKRLKLLDLFYCSIAKSNVYEVIGKCLQLEELYLYLFQSEQDFPNNVCLPPRLRRYVIIHDHSSYYIDRLDMHKPSRAFGIEGFNVSPQSFISLPIPIKDLFLRSDYLCLRHLQGGYRNVIPSMDPRGMNELIVLILESCPEIECLFDSTITNVDMLQSQVVFCSLVTLELYRMNGLQEVFHDTSSSCSLQNLQEISIRNCDRLYSISFPRNSKLFSLKKLRISSCPMLTCLFMPSIAQTLVLLESLEIYNCRELKNVIEEVKEGDVDYASSQSHTSLLLPKLRSLSIDGCDKMEYIFPLCFAEGLVSLETLVVKNNNEMKYVFGTEKEYQSQHETKIDINLLKLDQLKLVSLPNLVGIWPNYCRPRSPNLTWIDCRKCSRLSDLFVHAAGNHSDLQQDITTMEDQILSVVATTSNQLNDIPKFDSLWLGDVGLKGIFEFQIGDTNTQLHPFHFHLLYLGLRTLPELKFIWMGPTNFLRLQMLRTIVVIGCPKLRTIFSPTIVRSLPMLTQLRIWNCEELEQIFDSSDAQQLNTLYTCSQQLCFPKLWRIDVRKCNKLKCLFYNFVAAHFPNLTFLIIEECSELEKVFAFEREADDGGQEGRGQNEEQVILQKLTFIRLESLPNFKEIHPRFELKDHVEQIIEDGPKYSTKLYLHSDDPGSDQSN